MIEVLWRRGHADPNSDILPNEREVRHITKKIPDFKDEPSKTELPLNSIVIEVVFAPKAQCELEGSGIEHAWGTSKVLLRKINATLTTE